MESSEIITDGVEAKNLAAEIRAVPSPPRLTRRVLSGVSWNASSSLIGQVISFFRSVVIARLLLPEEFGLFSMALTIVLGLNALTTLGLDQTILARKFNNDTELHAQLNTVWSAELVRSLLLALLVLASAYPVAHFYGQPKLLSLIPILSLTTLFDGMQNIGLAILRKQISFARIFWYELTTNIVAAFLTIVLVVRLRSVMALVLGQLATALFGMIFSYVFHPYRPRFAFDKLALQRVISFGKFGLVIAVASYITTTADNVVVGRLLGASALGNYALAYTLASFPISVLVYGLGKATLPAFAELAASAPSRLGIAFTRVFTISSLLLICMLAPMFTLSNEIIQFLYGNTWANAAPVLKVLSLLIPMRGLTLIITSLLFGLNRPRPVASGKTFEAVIFLLLLYPFTRVLGLTGAAWAGVAVYALALVNRFVILKREIPGLETKLIWISLSALAAAVAGLFIAAFGLSFIESMWPRIIVGGLLATTVPATLLLLMRADLRKWIVETAH
ncbi:MAG TPA: oligosaccharide flippase family protein [Pyrinomonadaceae bacterium]|nr:oligosaccharide flippase family protein [Pyrinomonadaceae bacterium]